MKKSLPARPSLSGLARAVCAMAIFTAAAHAEVIDIDNERLARLMAEGVPLIDIRTAGEWKSSGVVPGSRLLTFFDERGQADPAWVDKAKSIAPPERPLILVCRSGNRTRAAARAFSEEAGYRTVYHLKHGLGGWTRDGRPTVPATPEMTLCPAGAAKC